MILNKRKFVQGFLALFGVAVVKPVVTVADIVAPSLPEGFVEIPKWCPKGWIPLMGQTITKEQFPALFTVVEKSNGRKFYPRYHGQNEARLEEFRPRLLDAMERAGLLGFEWTPRDPVKPDALLEYNGLAQKSYESDRLTRLPHRTNDEVVVSFLAVEDQKNARGQVFRAGFSMKSKVNRTEFEKTYGSCLPEYEGCPNHLDPEAG